MQFDDQQQKAIRSLNNTVVMAGAGAGKTSVLAERYLWLLKHGKAGVDQILTLTFTKKAAAEMYEKIYRRLKAEEDPGVREQLRNFGKAQISTLDSFCAQIVRNGSEYFGLAQDFTYDEGALADLLAETSLDFLLGSWKEPGAAVLLGLYGFERVLHDFLEPLAASFFNLARDYDFNAMFETQCAELERQLQKKRENFSVPLARLLELDTGGKKSIAAAQAAAAGLVGLEGSLGAGEYGKALELLRCFAPRKPGGQASAEILRFKELIDELKAAQAGLASVLLGLDKKEQTRQVLDLAAGFQELVNGVKRSRGLVSFDDVARMAVAVLEHDQGLRSYYKTRFRYIMIDEFQDNNRLQKELLYLLAEKQELSLPRLPEAAELEREKLLFVGDEKQSIYAFRGADVGVFKALHGELQNQGGSALPLPYNYRSEPGLIDFFNLVFRTIMQPAAEDYEARFQELRSLKKENTVTPEVHFFYKAYDDGGDAESDFSNDQTEAFRLAGFISRTVEGGKLLIDDNGSVRPAGYADIAVLMRSTGNQIIYEQMFRLYGVPYTTEGVRSLFLEAPLNDIYNILQLVVNPADRTAYAALLRSPLVNISDHAFVRIMLKEDPPFAEFGLEPDDAEKYAAGRELYGLLADRADRVPLTELIFEIWYAYGYRYHIMKNERFHNFLEYYDYLFRLAERADARGLRLARFLDEIRANLGRYEKQDDLQILKEYEQGVALMTIHKAKGLEFPVVVLANTGNRGRPEEKNPLYYVSPGFGLSLGLGEENYFYAELRRESEKKETAELKRLLYVALTRARSHLIISGVHNRQNRGSPKTHLNMLLRGLGMEDGFNGPVFTGGPAPSGTAAAADHDGGPAAAAFAAASGGGRAGLPEPEKPAGREAAGRGPYEAASSTPAAFEGGRFRFVKHVMKDLTLEEYSRLLRRPAKTDLAALKQVYAGLPEHTYEFRRCEYSVTELNECYNLVAFAQPARVNAASGPGPGTAPTRAEAALKLPALPIDKHLGTKKLELLFGSLTHYIIHARIAQKKDKIDVPSSYTTDFPEELRPRVLNQAGELAQGFFASDWGRLLKGADRVESEFPFLYKLRGPGRTLFVHGIMDLFFEAKDKVCVIDFKTDRVLDPREYALQLELYKRACAGLTGRRPECFLFALRGARPVYPQHEVEWEKLFEGL